MSYNPTTIPTVIYNLEEADIESLHRYSIVFQHKSCFVDWNPIQLSQSYHNRPLMVIFAVKTKPLLAVFDKKKRLKTVIKHVCGTQLWIGNEGLSVLYCELSCWRVLKNSFGRKKSFPFFTIWNHGNCLYLSLMFDTGDLKIIGFNKQQENCHLAVLIYRWLFFCVNWYYMELSPLDYTTPPPCLKAMIPLWYQYDVLSTRTESLNRMCSDSKGVYRYQDICHC